MYWAFVTLMIIQGSASDTLYFQPNDQIVDGTLCKDGSTTCSTSETCCPVDDGIFGCCKYPRAICCSDKLHCCPSGTTCDVSEGTCNRGEVSVPWLEKQPSLPTSKGDNSICPDSQSSCPEGSTCCNLISGQYGCCPHPKAQCCSDKIHCCPDGTECDLEKKSCKRGYSLLHWRDPVPATPVPTQATEVMCPGGQQECPNGSTCCKMVSGDYGCCPLPEAVCCSDREHCCPAHTVCHVKEGKCTHKPHSTPWVAHESAQTLS